MTVRTARIAGSSNWGLRFVGLGGAALALLALPAPALAQDSNDETRLRKLESEVRALQRRVFPAATGAISNPRSPVSRKPALWFRSHRRRPSPISSPGSTRWKPSFSG